MRFEGIFTALVTPFYKGEFDRDSMEALIHRQLEAGVAGVVVCGTTGETPTLTDEEYEKVVGFVVAQAKGKTLVVAGAGTNSTKTTIERCKVAKALGVDAVLVVTPYYNKPTQEGLFAHFAEVAKALSLPLIIYNVPSRTGVNITPDTVTRLAQLPYIVGIKEASGSVDAVREIVRNTPESFSCLSGDDGLALPSFAVGAVGVVSVASNVVPEAMVRLWELWKAGDTKGARMLDQKLAPLYKALFVETNPVPCKAALFMKGMIRSEEVRLPLLMASKATKEALEKALSAIE
jgi:4-hydroxy-tetrahydrodipicolinate synthase